jgi:hypothetical protein
MYVSITNQSKLLGIPRDDIIEMMLTGLNFYDASITSYVSKINGVEQEIIFDDDAIDALKEKLNSNDFSLQINGSLIQIESEVTPPSLFFLLDGWADALKSENLYNDSFYILIPHRHKGALFIGEFETINRLSDDFDGEYDILSIQDLKKG